jgi:hypothetical protein
MKNAKEKSPSARSGTREAISEAQGLDIIKTDKYRIVSQIIIFFVY